ncbi:uncharacterized protein [Nicotiana sylvestris]|nr:PREDICTED: uncharacterized protein LOC104213012 isoform X2 [Nicotiana sylvestris]
MSRLIGGGEPNVKEKELLMEREVFDETYIKRFNTYVDFSSPPRHIFGKQIRDSGDAQSIDANFKKLFDGQAMLNKEIGKDKFAELFKALEIKNKNNEKETNNYGDLIGQVSKDGDTNSIYFQHLQDNQQDKIDVHDHDINVDNDKQEYRNVNDADENIERNNMDMLSAGEMVLYGQWGEILETQMVGVTKSQIIKPFTRDVPNNITPVNVPRKRRPAAVFKSPYVNDFSSGGNPVEDKQNNFAANVKLPFEASITEEASFEMLHEFAKWVDIGLKGKRGTPYS